MTERGDGVTTAGGGMTDRFLTVLELAAALSISRRMAYSLVWAKRVPSLRIGRSIRIPASVVARLVDDVVAGGGITVLADAAVSAAGKRPRPRAGRGRAA